jgi:hypothetical protein
MNELKTTGLGGFPLVLDDIRFQYAAIKEALKGIVSTFSLQSMDGLSAPRAVILWGCGVTVDAVSVSPLVKYTVAEGFISLGGEVFYVPTMSINVNSTDTVYFVITESYDATGSKTFADASVQDTYLVRRATISASYAGSAYYAAITSTVDFKSMIRANILPIWTLLSPTFPSGCSGSVALGYDGLNRFIRVQLSLISGYDVANLGLPVWTLYDTDPIAIILDNYFLYHSFPVILETSVGSTSLPAQIFLSKTSGGNSTGTFSVYNIGLANVNGSWWAANLTADTKIRFQAQVTFN